MKKYSNSYRYFILSVLYTTDKTFCRWIYYVKVHMTPYKIDRVLFCYKHQQKLYLILLNTQNVTILLVSLAHLFKRFYCSLNVANCICTIPLQRNGRCTGYTVYNSRVQFFQDGTLKDHHTLQDKQYEM